MSKWRIVKLGQAADLLDCLHKTPTYVEVGIPIVRVTDIRKGYLNLSGCFKIDEKTFKDFSKNYVPKKGNIVFSRVGTYGVSSLVKEKQQFCLGQNTVLLIPKLINGEFLFYYLTSNDANAQIEGLVGGSTQPTISMKSIRDIDIPVPPLPEQEAIAEVLSSLDDKIDLLHRNNKTLETMAETLFRQWFVEEADELVRLGSVLKTTSGGTPSRAISSYYHGDIPWIKSKELSNGFILNTEEHITNDALKNSSAKMLPPFCVLIAMYGATVGELGITTGITTCNQAIAAIPETADYPYSFLFNFFKSNKDEIINLAIGAAQQNISQVLIQDLMIPAPSKRIIEYGLIVKPYYEKILNNTKQIQNLEELRDTLLPKLMSGTVKVNNLVTA